MSAEVTRSTGKFLPDARKPVRHVIIIFGGDAPIAGHVLTGSGFFPGVGGELVGWVENKLKPRLNPRGVDVHVGGWGGTLSEDPHQPSEFEALDFVRAHFDGRGKVIVYGCSAGGLMALNFCGLLKEKAPFFSFDQDRMVAQDPVNDQMVGLVKVDLLLTGDPSLGRGKNPLIPKIPGLVLRHTNWFQTLPRRGLRNAPHVSEPGSKVEIKNIDCTRRLTAVLADVEQSLSATQHVRAHEHLMFADQLTPDEREEAFAIAAHRAVCHDTLPEVETAMEIEFGLPVTLQK